MQELLDDFDLYGYAVLPAVVPVADVAAITRALLPLLERQPGYPEQHAVGRQGLLNDDPAFDALLTNETHHAVASHIFAGSYKFGETGVVLSKAGRRHLGFHFDTPYGSFASHRSGIPETGLILQAIYTLTDFTKENGATRILPLSHHIHGSGNPRPKGDTDYRHAISVEAPAGSIILFHGRMWHTAADNYTDQDRLGISVVYVHSTIDTLVCGWNPLRQDVIDRQPDFVKQRMFGSVVARPGPTINPKDAPPEASTPAPRL
jgi:hypothetical protein